MDSLPRELECPITMELLADPVTAPCCGRTFSRAPLSAWHSSVPRCPMCNGDLSNVDVSKLPRNVAISYMVEEYLKKAAQPSSSNPASSADVQDLPPPRRERSWAATLHKITGYGRSVIGCLDIKAIGAALAPQSGLFPSPASASSSGSYKTLVIPVVDESGSMSGSPTRQVQYSLARIVDLVFDTPHLLSHVVCYSDQAHSFKIDRTRGKDENMLAVHRVGRGGGTSFTSAFREIVNVIRLYKDDPDITSIEILFLTDGEDSSVHAGPARQKLVNDLKAALLAESVPNPNLALTLHSIGFAREHDFEFLNALRVIGSKEGAYRYADPSDHPDALAQKIGSLFLAIASASPTPIRFQSMSTEDAKILNIDGSRIWIDLTKAVHTVPPQVTFTVKDQSYTITADFAEEDNEKEICDAWYSQLTDELSAELLLLTQNDASVASSAASGSKSSASKSCSGHSSNNDLKALHIELVMRRANALLMRLSQDHPARDRLLKVLDTCKSIQSGAATDARKLNDLKFEGKYGGNISGGSSASAVPVSSIVAPSIAQFRPKGEWHTIDISDRSKVPHLRVPADAHQALKIIANTKTADAVSRLEEIGNPLSVINSFNISLLHFASIIGRIPVIKYLLSLSPSVDYLNAQTKPLSAGRAPTFTAADLALLFGRWHSFELLVAAGATISVSPELLLLQTCLSNGYFNSAKALLKHRQVDVDGAFIARAPTSEIATWLGRHSSIRVSLATAINQGMVEEVEKRLRALRAGNPIDPADSSFTFSYANHPTLLEKTSDEHLQVMECLLELQFAKADEVYAAPDDDDDEITWPLFVAAQSGNMQVFQLLLSTDDSSAHINRQNKKGTTALWIASCNRHIDIVFALLGRGADPNICNLKGDGPLIPACQKGSQNVAEALLDAGASLESYNKNRDNPVLICCRTGQAKILKLLLERIDSSAKRAQILAESAEIDGFDPLHASAELDRVECIKVCVAMGAIIEARTKVDNPIIAGATALHLASFYGRAASVSALVELGADPLALTEIPESASVTTVRNSTALHLAVKQGHANVVRALLAIPSVRSSFTSMLDGEGHLASYYAQSEANAELYTEFFEDRLSPILNSILFTQPSPSSSDLEKSTMDLLTKYSQSLGVYSYKDFLSDASAGGDAPLLSSALLTGKYELASGLINMLGADLRRPDAHGITPEFWAHYVGFNLHQNRSQPLIAGSNVASSSDASSELSSMSISSATSSSAPVAPAYIQAMLDRISKASKKSLQNKILLTPPQLGGSKKLIASSSSTAPSFDIVLKMIDGYKTSVKPRVVEELRGYASKKSVVEESLIGLTDKLKSSRKLFPEGEDTMEALIWEARIHLIRAIASAPESDSPSLDPVNYLAIFLYTAHPDIFSKVNLTLADWQNQKIGSKNDAQVGSMWKQFVQCLYRSLTILPAYSGELYRTVPAAFDPKEYSIGSTVSWNSFSVTTRSWNNLTNWTNESPKSDPRTKRGVIFIIQSKTARRIEKFSRFPIESEAIILPGTHFVVKNHYIASIIAFGQANIRTSTYLAKETDLTKAAAGETSIIVELEEVIPEPSSPSRIVEELN